MCVAMCVLCVRMRLAGGTLRSGVESLLSFLPATVGVVIMLTLLVGLCALRGNTNRPSYGDATTQPFLSTAVVSQGGGVSDHVYVNQPTNQHSRQDGAVPSAAPPVPSGRLSPQYASVTTERDLLQKVYVSSYESGTEGTGSGQAQRGYEVPLVSVKQQENGVGEVSGTGAVRSVRLLGWVNCYNHLCDG